MSRENTIKDSTNVKTSEPEYAVVTTDPKSKNINATDNYGDVIVNANPAYHSNVKTKMDADPAYHQKLN